MPGLDDTGMDRPYRNFVDTFTFYFVNRMSSSQAGAYNLPQTLSEREFSEGQLLMKHKPLWIRMPHWDRYQRDLFISLS